MNQAWMLFPMLALVGWTMLVMSLMGFKRVTSRVHPKEFRLGESAAVPPEVSLPNRNFMNLLEMPVLFYVVCLTFYVTQHVTRAAVVLAWTFVALRVAHSFVHLSYNNVLHRLACFALANLALLALWIMLLVRLA